MSLDRPVRVGVRARPSPLPLVAAALGGLGVQAWWARRAYQHLPDVGYLVDATVAPGGDPAGPGTGPGLRLVALGDSSVAGVGAPTAADSLPVQVARRLAEATGRPVAVRGHGASGARTRDILEQVAAADLAGDVALVLVVVGTNDVLHLRTPSGFRRDSLELYRTIRRRSTAPVVVCSLPELRAVQAVPRPLADLAAAYARLLDRRQRAAAAAVPGVRWVDARRLVGPTFRADPATLAADGFHPSPLGYARMADVLSAAALQALAATRGVQERAGWKGLTTR